jgi:predicted metal-dependent phosphotriesterase family hydrolase
MILTMLAEGWGKQILLGMDAPAESIGVPAAELRGYVSLLHDFVPRLGSGGLNDIDAIFIQNPGRCCAFDSIAASGANARSASLTRA